MIASLIEDSIFYKHIGWKSGGNFICSPKVEKEENSDAYDAETDAEDSDDAYDAETDIDEGNLKGTVLEIQIRKADNNLGHFWYIDQWANKTNNFCMWKKKRLDTVRRTKNMRKYEC